MIIIIHTSFFWYVDVKHGTVNHHSLVATGFDLGTNSKMDGAFSAAGASASTVGHWRQSGDGSGAQVGLGRWEDRLGCAWMGEILSPFNGDLMVVKCLSGFQYECRM